LPQEEAINSSFADHLLSPRSFPSPCLSQSGPGLIKVALGVVDLFRIVMVVHHSKLLDSVPSLSVQFSNDCDWLSQQLQIIPRLNQLEETKILAERLNGVGMVVREKQLVIDISS
jgi:hypothetical protein